MADIADDAAYHEQLAANIGLKLAQSHAAAISMLNEGMECLNCGERVQSREMRWCSPECRDDEVRRRSIRNG